MTLENNSGSAGPGVLRLFGRQLPQGFPDRGQHTIVRGKHFMLAGSLCPPGQPQSHDPSIEIAKVNH
jgi:hypothetical protein